MKKALINPNQTASHISSWQLIDGVYTPVYENYIDSQIVAEVCSDEFPVAEPLYWLDCEDNITAYDYYYDTQTSTFKEVINAPYPTNDYS
jgi:hypothetical protein